MQAYTDTLHATQRESNLTTAMLQDIPTFYGQDTSKLEHWFMDIETAADILAKCPTCLAKAKSHSLAHTYPWGHLNRKVLGGNQGNLRLKICNANIHTYTSRFMEIQKKDNVTQAAYIHHFKTAAKQCTFDNDTVAIHILLKGFRDTPIIASKYMRRTPKP